MCTSLHQWLGAAADEANTCSREQLHGVIIAGEEVIDWPRENTLRAKYYLSQAMKGATGLTSAEAERMEKGAIEELERFLQSDDTGMGERYKGNYPMLFDYLVHWEHRLVTPRKSDRAAEAAVVPELEG